MQHSTELQETDESLVDCQIKARPADLLKSLQLVLPIVPKTSNINQMLTNFLLDIDNNYLKVTGFDYKNTIIAEQELTDLKGKTKLCIQAHLIYDILKALDSSEVIVLKFSGYKLTIDATCGVYNLNAQNENQYPKIQKSESVFAAVLDSELLARIIKIRYACSTDDLRPAQQGILFKFKKQYSEFVACDGHIAHQIRRYDIKLDDHEALIPGKSLASVEPLIKGEDFVKLSLMRNHFAFSATSTQFITTQIQDKFYDYEHPLNSEWHSKSVLINRQMLISSLERISLLQPNFDRIKMEIEPNQIRINAESYLGDVQETITHYSEFIYSYDILFNIKSLLPVIKHLDSLHVELKYQIANPLVFFLPSPQREHEEEKILIVTMKG